MLLRHEPSLCRRAIHGDHKRNLLIAGVCPGASDQLHPQTSIRPQFWFDASQQFVI